MSDFTPAQQRAYESEIFHKVVATIGLDRAQLTNEAEPFDDWYDRMREAGHIYERVDIASVPVDQRLAALAAEEAAEARGAVLVDDVTPTSDPLTEAATQLRQFNPVDRFNQYKARRGALLEE